MNSCECNGHACPSREQAAARAGKEDAGRPEKHRHEDRCDDGDDDRREAHLLDDEARLLFPVRSGSGARPALRIPHTHAFLTPAGADRRRLASWSHKRCGETTAGVRPGTWQDRADHLILGAEVPMHEGVVDAAAAATGRTLTPSTP